MQVCLAFLGQDLWLVREIQNCGLKSIEPHEVIAGCLTKDLHGRLARKMAHSFPWTTCSQVQTALSKHESVLSNSSSPSLFKERRRILMVRMSLTAYCNLAREIPHEVAFQQWSTLGLTNCYEGKVWREGQVMFRPGILNSSWMDFTGWLEADWENVGHVTWVEAMLCRCCILQPCKMLSWEQPGK